MRDGGDDSLMHRYYSFDESVMREFLGKKLTGGIRKEIAVISEKTHKSQRCVRRQLENFRRVFRCIGDLDGDPWSLISEQFYTNMSQQLVDSYATVIFYCTNRVESSLKRLSALTYQDLEGIGKVCVYISILFLHVGYANELDCA